MNKIPSFTINHEKLLRGIYVSRKDEVGGEVVTTFDIRMKEPNREPVMHPGALHTIEHLAATFLRNDAEWKDRVIYWGPMGVSRATICCCAVTCSRKTLSTLCVARSSLLRSMRERYRVRLPAIVEIICFMICLWRSGKHVSSLQKCLMT